MNAQVTGLGVPHATTRRSTNCRSLLTSWSRTSQRRRRAGETLVLAGNLAVRTDQIVIWQVLDRYSQAVFAGQLRALTEAVETAGE
jgi:hypothetical protein